MISVDPSRAQFLSCSPVVFKITTHIPEILAGLLLIFFSWFTVNIGDALEGNVTIVALIVSSVALVVTDNQQFHSSSAQQIRFK
jgi:Ca2+/Na+ antiporter